MTDKGIVLKLAVLVPYLKIIPQPQAYLWGFHNARKFSCSFREETPIAETLLLNPYLSRHVMWLQNLSLKNKRTLRQICHSYDV